MDQADELNDRPGSPEALLGGNENETPEKSPVQSGDLTGHEAGMTEEGHGMPGVG